MRSILGQGVPFEVMAMEGFGGVDSDHEAHLAKQETMDDMKRNATGSDKSRQEWIDDRRRSQAQ
jgi:hypothetical protein